MAKSTKTKKVEVVEEPKVELPIEPIIETPEIGYEPPSVTLEEVKEVGIKEDAAVLNKNGKTMTTQEHLQIFNDTGIYIGKEDLPMEQRIENFLEGKEDYVRANDFLKSLFGIPKFNEPAKWLIQGNSKLLKATLEKMVSNNDIVVRDNQHRLLGQSYYPDSTTGKQEHRNLNNIEIFMKK